MIWNYALPGPRVVKLSSDPKLRVVKGYGKTPGMLHANHEAREIALKHYTPAFGALFNDRNVYFDFDVDGLMIDDRFMDDVDRQQGIRGCLSDIWEKVRWIIMPGYAHDTDADHFAELPFLQRVILTHQHVPSPLARIESCSSHERGNAKMTWYIEEALECLGRGKDDIEVSFFGPWALGVTARGAKDGVSDELIPLDPESGCKFWPNLGPPSEGVWQEFIYDHYPKWRQRARYRMMADEEAVEERDRVEDSEEDDDFEWDNSEGGDNAYEENSEEEDDSDMWDY